MAAVDRIGNAVHDAVLRWAEAFIARVMRDVVPSIVRQDATEDDIDAILNALDDPEVSRALLESAFKAVDRASSDDLRVIGVQTETVVRNAERLQAEWLRQSTDLIRATEDVRRRVERILKDPVSEGRSVADISKLLQEQAGYAASRAELTARTVTLQTYGKIQEQRQRDAGFTKYVWTTSLDERVREDHAELDGTVQSWDDPPVVDKRTGRRGHPGSDFQCRCSAVPYADPDEAVEPLDSDAEDRAFLERLEAERIEQERAAAEAERQREREAERRREEARQREIERRARRTPAEVVNEFVQTAPSVRVADEPKVPKARKRANEAAADKLKASLSDEQSNALADFTGSGFRTIRALQQGKSVAEVAKELDVSEKYVSQLQAQLQPLAEAQQKMRVASPTDQGVLYRGLALNDDNLAKLLNEETLEFLAASNSTTYDVETATDFASRAIDQYRKGDTRLSKVLLRIESVDQGGLAMYTDNIYQAEQEVIIGRSKFKITGRRFDAETQTYVIDLQQVGTSRFDEQDAETAARTPVDLNKFVSNGDDIKFG